jgi:SEC-C motif-containing protein
MFYTAVLLSTLMVIISQFTQAFVVPAPSRLDKSQIPSHSGSVLNAKKSTKQTKNQSNKNKNQNTSGFGGAATVPCPCGSGLGYMKCCGKLHKDAKAYAEATPEQVVRARYSAYAKREVDFIVGSTHPLNKNFISDIDHWKETIRTNCYDNFELTSCEIISESIDGDGKNQSAKVQFVARMTQVDSREKTAFMETSTFERAGQHIANGAWLYKEGVIESVPGMPDALDLEAELKKEGKEKMSLKEQELENIEEQTLT